MHLLLTKLPLDIFTYAPSSQGGRCWCILKNNQVMPYKEWIYKTRIIIFMSSFIQKSQDLFPIKHAYINSSLFN